MICGSVVLLTNIETSTVRRITKELYIYLTFIILFPILDKSYLLHTKKNMSGGHNRRKKLIMYNTFGTSLNILYLSIYIIIFVFIWSQKLGHIIGIMW